MRRLLVACGASLLVYLMVFGSVLDRPLTLGFLRAQLDAKVARGNAILGPKLVILAGSNGPYSHRCETIEPIVGMACINAGVAVGIGLDYLFARWKTLLRAGDVVYLPLEESQYTRPRASSRLGPDAAIMWRHDRITLWALPPNRWIAALFAFDLRSLVMSLIETSLVAGGFHDPRAGVTGATNEWGDHVGHTAALAVASRRILAAVTPVHVTAAGVRGGDGSVQIAEFLAWARGHGVRAIGGFPTEFADAPMPTATLAAIHDVFVDAGGMFLDPANHCRYPREDFFDTSDHLNETAQIAHSKMIAIAMRELLDGAAQTVTIAGPAPAANR